MRKLTILFIFAFLIISLTSSVSAQLDLGVYKQNSEVELLLDCAYSNGTLCSTATTCNITRIQYPNNSFMVSNVRMGDADYPTFNYTVPDTSVLGEYKGTQFCQDGSYSGIASFVFEITPSGFLFSTANSITLILVIFIILLTSGFFLFLFTRTGNNVMKNLFVGLSSFFMFLAVLFGMTIIYTVLGGFENIIEGYNAFFFIITTGSFMAVLALVIFIMIWSLKKMQIRRGLIEQAGKIRY